MKKFIFFTAILLIGISLFFVGGNSNNNEEKIFKNAVTPSPVQVAGFALGEDVPFLAVNLIKFKEKAEYADVCLWLQLEQHGLGGDCGGRYRTHGVFLSAEVSRWRFHDVAGISQCAL